MNDPQLAFQASSPLPLAVSNRTASLVLRLLGRGEMPLATAPMPVEVRSSDPRVIRVVSSPVEFKTGQSSATVNVEILSPGVASLTAVAPATFSTPGQTGTGVLTVVVR